MWHLGTELDSIKGLFPPEEFWDSKEKRSGSPRIPALRKESRAGSVSPGKSTGCFLAMTELMSPSQKDQPSRTGKLCIKDLLERGILWDSLSVPAWKEIPRLSTNPPLPKQNKSSSPAARLLFLCFATPGVLTMELHSPELPLLPGIADSQPGAARHFQHSKDAEDTPQRAEGAIPGAHSQ